MSSAAEKHPGASGNVIPYALSESLCTTALSRCRHQYFNYRLYRLQRHMTSLDAPGERRAR